MRIIEDVVDGYWTKIRLALCAVCDKLLIEGDRRAWGMVPRIYEFKLDRHRKGKQ